MQISSARVGSKAAKSKEEESGAGEDDQIVLFLSMLDGVCDEHEGVRASDPVTYCQLVEDELVELAIGYGEDYGAEHAVRSATSPDFPLTSLFPHHPLSQTPFSSVVDMQPDRNGHGGEILRVMGGGVTVSQVGAAYGVDGWVVICMLCILKALPVTDLGPSALMKLERFARTFKKDTGFHASPSAFTSWLKDRSMQWKPHVYKRGVL